MVLWLICKWRFQSLWCSNGTFLIWRARQVPRIRILKEEPSHLHFIREKVTCHGSNQKIWWVLRLVSLALSHLRSLVRSFNPVHCPPHCYECSPSRPRCPSSQWPLLSEKLEGQGTWRDTCAIKPSLNRQEEEEADSAFYNYAISRYFDTVFQGSVLKRKISS